MSRDVRLLDCEPYSTTAFPRARSPGSSHEPSPSSASSRSLCSFNVGLRGLKNLCHRPPIASSDEDTHGVARIQGFGSVRAFLRSFGDVDVVCAQETKLSRLDVPRLGRVDDEWDSAHSVCDVRGKESYSGVAVYWRCEVVRPRAIEEGVCGTRATSTGVFDAMDEAPPFANDRARAKELDGEGRALWIDFDAFVLCNVYVPAICGDVSKDERARERERYKVDFLRALETRYRSLLSRGRRVMLCGDWNIAPNANIDRATSGNARATGDLSRDWMREQLDSRLVDVFRAAHPEVNDAFTCWNVASGAQLNNYGSRIDYFLLDDELAKSVRAVGVAQSHQGSDHAPVFCALASDAWPEFDAATPTPALACSALFPGRQSKLDEMFLSASSAGARERELDRSREAFVSSSRLDAKQKIQAQPKRKAPAPEKSIRDFFAVKIAKSESESTDARAALIDSESAEFATPRVDASTRANESSAEDARAEWMKTFAKMAPPKCRGHNDVCKVRAVKQRDNPNYGRVFFCCPRPAGTTPESDCGFFKWRPDRKTR